MIMIDLKECIKCCIENCTAEEATERLYKFVNDSLELKEKEIQLINSIKIPDILKGNKEYINDKLYLMNIPGCIVLNEISEIIYNIIKTALEGRCLVFTNDEDFNGFIKEHVTIKYDFQDQSRIFYLDGIPFLFHSYKFVDTSFLETASKHSGNINLTASHGAFRYL